MDQDIKSIAHTICGTPLSDEPCNGCPKDDGNCPHILTAKCVHTDHIKPLEDALDRIEVDFGAYVYHTTNGQLSKPYDAQMLITMHDEAVSNDINKAVAEMEAKLAKADAEKAVLMDALDECLEMLTDMQRPSSDNGTMSCARTALARVKGNV